MSGSCLSLLALLGAVHSLAAGQAAKVQPKSGATASGVFLGRSGKPMAKARLFLGEVTGDQEVTYARIKLPPALPAASCDDQGRFQFKGFPPGEYTILYQPAGGAAVLPAEISIRAFLATTRSIAPLLRGVELGKNDPFPERPWGREFILLKGHTMYSEGATMKIWNATARRGQQGPYLEIRRGLIWLERVQDKGQIKFEAWSY